jgi:hypothetical protein
VKIFKLRAVKLLKADRWTDRRADLGALVVMLLFFAARFGRAIWQRHFLIIGDAFFYTLPLRTTAWAMIKHGTLPIWTPLVLSGYPMLAMTQLGLGYPLTWAYLCLPNYWAEQIFIFAPFILAPAFTYAYARTTGRTPTAALLAGLSYGYGGLMTNSHGINGIPTNALLWLPLMLVALERARTRRFVPSLLLATLAYTCSVLTGHGQSFLQVGMLALAYALFLALEPAARLTDALTDKTTDAAAQTRLSWARWRPLFVTVSAIALAGGVAAWQILETMRAARRSIRSTLSYDVFTAGSFAPAETLRSLIVPLAHYVEVTTYQAPLVCALGVVAIACAIRRRAGCDARVFFWCGCALGAWWLMLGGYTSLYRLLYHVPIFNLFRYPSRHAFEWTFALSMLGAYGWDAVGTRPKTRPPARMGLKVAIGLVALLLSVVLGVLWYRAFTVPNLEANYVRWKLWFTLSTTFVIIYSWRVLAPTWRAALTFATLLLVCAVEPFILIGNWWGLTGKTSAQLTQPALTTRWLQQFPPVEQRVYIRATGDDEEGARQPHFDGVDRTAPFGLHNVSGYEQLLLNRYSRALGNVDADALSQRPGYPTARSLFEPESHVLDLLNTGYVAAWPNLAPRTEMFPIKRDGVEFASSDLTLEIKPNETVNVQGLTGTGDTLALVTSLANSGQIKQGTTIARLRIMTGDGHTIERELQAGRDTAEWAHERADVRANIAHQLAPVFDSHAADLANSFTSLRYWTRVALGPSTSIKRIEIENVAPPVLLVLWKATLYDSQTHRSNIITNLPDAFTLDPYHWQLAADLNGAVILRNLRACPRAWLVSEAEAVDGEEALKRIRGESAHAFDPRRTALLEVKSDELPQLPGGALSPQSEARIVSYEPAHLLIETNAPTATVLVVSEIFYPGWVATVDGQAARIDIADYLLRGMALPAGRHTIEMRYTAPAARTGAIISTLTLCVIVGLCVYAWRARVR